MNNRTLGKYEIVERLGRGGMAEVYRAYHANLDRYVAIKVLHSFLADDAEFKTRFEKEARNIARLKHAHIVQVYDFEFDTSDESYYMVMELIDGVTLKDRMLELEKNDERFPLADALRVSREAASALAYAHKAGMIHRDVKPANLMLDKHEQDRVVLTDFGIAKMVTGAQFTMTGGLVGTPAYMSPEQGVGETGDERSDLYSLGIILFQMLSGYPPYEAETPLALILKHMNDPIPSVCESNPRLPEEVDTLIGKAMAKEPGNRFQTANDLIAAISALEGTLVTRPVRLRVPPPTPPQPANLLQSEPSIEVAPQPELAAPVAASQPVPQEEDTIKLSDTRRREKLPIPRSNGKGNGAAQKGRRSLLLMVAGTIIILGGILGGYVAAANNGILPAIGFLASETPTDTPSPTMESSPTMTSTVTATPSPTASATETATATATSSATPTNTTTITPSDTSTVTASATATSTATATATPTVTNTATASPIPALNITQTAQALATTMFAACTFDYAIIEHDPADGAEGGFFPVNTTYERTIRLLNTGTCAWERNTSLTFINGTGENFSAGPRVFIREEVGVGEETEMLFSGTLPNRGAVGPDGNVIPIGGDWQLRTPGQIAIGEPLTISILVFDPG